MISCNNTSIIGYVNNNMTFKCYFENGLAEGHCYMNFKDRIYNIQYKKGLPDGIFKIDDEEEYLFKEGKIQSAIKGDINGSIKDIQSIIEELSFYKCLLCCTFMNFTNIDIDETSLGKEDIDNILLNLKPVSDYPDAFLVITPIFYRTYKIETKGLLYLFSFIFDVSYKFLLRHFIENIESCICCQTFIIEYENEYQMLDEKLIRKIFS